MFSTRNNVNFTSYADDNTPYVIGDGVIQVIKFLKDSSDELFCWFVNNQRKSNHEMCHSITSSGVELSVHVAKYKLESSKWGKRFVI